MNHLLRDAIALVVTHATAGCIAAAQLPPTTATFGGATTVTVPLRLIHGLIVVPVTINGHGPLQLILDTGAPVILVPDTALAARLRLQVVGQARVGGTGDGAAATAPLAAGITARIGALEVTGAYGTVGVAASVIPGVDGVIGGAFFSHAAVEVDWDASVVRFHNPDARAYNAPGDTIPLRVEPSLHAYIPGRVAIAGDTVGVELHLDTGARQALTLSPSTVARFRSVPSPAVATIVGFGSRGAALGRYVRTEVLQLGHALVVRPPAAIPDNEPSDQARVGLPVLKKFNFVIDYSGRVLVLRPRSTPSDSLRFTTTGLVLAPGRDSVPRVVAHVIAGSPAHDAGLAAGDTVIRIGGRSVSTMTEDTVASTLLTPDAGTAVVVVVTRGATTIARQFAARVLLP